ncbi:KINESIN FAMILY MEMBER 1A [Salix koriyanagi]|uniref:KINESIN FAMILY MEMBER 1A n=1 Tax=Salix koriyanagi TaxID=2511006 RepID=A0A9Q0ZM02_9ROSI|nr:KINESIN FAMILY MEMBER 1A [Salix koriyanagi]
MYERAASKSNYKNVNGDENEQNDMLVHDNDSPPELAKVSGREMKTVENLEQQLMEMHDENEKTDGRRASAKTGNEIKSLELLSSEIQEKRALVDKKLSALRYSVSSFDSSIAYFEQREHRAKARVSASTSYLEKKKEELAHLQLCKEESEATMGRIQQSEIEFKNVLAVLKSKLMEASQRQESEKVLFAIDNIENVNTSQRNWQLGSRATELLKCEEEKTKLQNEMKLSRENLGRMKKEIDVLSKKLGKIESEIQGVHTDIQKGSKSVEEMEVALQAVIQEKETLLETRETGMHEIQSMILEYQQRVFDADLKGAEKKMLEEELQLGFRRNEELKVLRAEASEKMTRLLENTSSRSCFARKMEE